ncbi:MAG: hypothetical protein EBS91_00055 [Betaproteobacteria bacterium]|nr:hypothetical protein [Betaproteobacteria bacterium]NCA23028.1 hypothetical protein [Betaproteobacteria bacterium]
MISLEVVIIESAEDAAAAEHVGVYAFTIDDTECDNCGVLTGPLAGDFFPCALAACTDEDDDSERPTVLCLDCIGGLLWPGEASILNSEDYD